MKKLIILCLLFISVGVMAGSFTVNGKGLKYSKSKYDVATTADRYEAVLRQKGFTIFNRIDHAAGAQSVGMELPPTELIIFGNPVVGTQLMKCQRTVGIDLPQKALIYENSAGDVLLAYNDPMYLNVRHKLRGCRNLLENVKTALAVFARAATK